jgi:hypothetical protein
VNPLVLSGSSLNVYMECPRQWQYTYLWVKQVPPSYKMALGIAAHEAVEVMFRDWKASGYLPTNTDRWLQAFDASWFEITKDTRPKNNQPAESAEAHRRSGHQVVGFYARQVAPTIEVYAFEEPMAVTINGHTWTGTIDLIDKMPDGRLRLRDHKFTSKKPDGTNRYRRPMIGYYLGATAKYGEIAAVQVDYVIRGNRDRPPTFMPILMEIGQQDILDFATDVEEAVSNINAGRFPPLGRETLACRWCPYRKVCKYARLG